MIPISGKPLLEHQIELAKRHGFAEIIIFACYRPDLIENHFGDGSRWGVRISYIVEKEPLGTAGAVLAGFDSLAETFLVLYGDTMVNIDLERMWNTHLKHRADATLLLHPNDHPLDSDLVETDSESWVRAFHNRPHPPEAFFQNLVNAALYVINREALRPWRTPSPAPGVNVGVRAPLDFGKDLFPAMLVRGAKLYGYNTPEYIKDIGTPERYDRICAELDRGLIQRSSLGTQQRAVFLDRDGTINTEVDGVASADKLELLPGAAEAIHTLNHHGYRVVLVTNQPVVAKGFCTEADIQQIHNKLETLLGRDHAFLDRIYYCPHHPEKGFPGERADLKIECNCRKPNPGMVLQAAQDLNIDLAGSWFVGDSSTDMQTAKNAGVRSILLRTGHGGHDGKYSAAPGHIFENLKDAAEWIVAQP
jgi:histidinol-phosphate phosphatase family protein